MIINTTAASLILGAVSKAPPTAFLGTCLTGASADKGWNRSRTHIGTPTMADIKSPIYEASLPVLEDLWRVRYGDIWVTFEELSKDKEFVCIAQRLLATNRLEKHQLADSQQEVFKLIEK